VSVEYRIHIGHGIDRIKLHLDRVICFLVALQHNTVGPWVPVGVIDSQMNLSECQGSTTAVYQPPRLPLSPPGGCNGLIARGE
jgi:hypothetical protein